MKVLFICTANVCRSPVAEHYLRYLAQKIGPLTLDIASGGTRAPDGAPPDPIAVRLLEDRGVVMPPHRSRQTTREDLESADEIFAMERRHKAWVRLHHPEFHDKVVVLENVSPSGIPDPTGGSLEEYRLAFDLLFAEVERVALGYRYPR